MKDNVMKTLDLLIRNKEAFDHEFVFDDNLINISASLAYLEAGKEVDVERIKECKQYMKQNSTVFSGIRSRTEPILVGKMALNSDMESYFENVRIAYKKISKLMFYDSSYLAQAAICICDAKKLDSLDEVDAKFRALYKRMEKVHPILTSSEDIVFAMLLTLTDRSIDEIIESMEECYNYMKKEVKLKVAANEIQGLGEILALTGGDMKSKCDKVVKLYNTFKEHGAKYGADYSEFSTLATLIDIDADPDELVDEIIETANELKTHKGFGSWSMDKRQRLMFASIIVGYAYNSERALENSVAITSTIAVVIAEELAIMMCMMMSSTANVVSSAITS